MKIQLIHNDCMDALPNIPSDSIDLICTDLPYGQTAQNEWDIMIPLEDYVVLDKKNYYKKDFFLKMFMDGYEKKEIIKFWNLLRQNGLWTEYERIIKEHGAIVLFGNGMFTARLMLSNIKLWRYNLIWKKTQPTGFLNANRMPLRAHEDICVFYKKLPKYFPQKTDGHIRKVSTAEHKKNSKKTSDYGDYSLSTYDSTERYPTSIWEFSKDTQKSALHPTQKPVLLLEEIIKTYTEEGDFVLDSCMGSNSCGIACKNLNRNYIGIEKNKEIYQLAVDRYNQ